MDVKKRERHRREVWGALGPWHLERLREAADKVVPSSEGEGGEKKPHAADRLEFQFQKKPGSLCGGGTIDET